jgi:hypothetical protein
MLLEGLHSEDSEASKGQFLIQLNLNYQGKKRSMLYLLGSLNVWKIGRDFGRADDLLFFCNTTGCKGLVDCRFRLSPLETARIESLAAVAGVEITYDRWPPDIKHKYENWWTDLVGCPVCMAVCKREDLADTYNFRLPVAGISKIMVELFRGLDSRASILMVRHKNDLGFHKVRETLRNVSMNRAAYEKALEEARDKEMAVYKMDTIHKDVAAGSSLESAFTSLIRS